MSKNKKDEELNNEELNNQDISKENSLEEIEPELEETESYKKANFRERLSLKFRKKLIASRFNTLVLVVLIIAIVFGVNIWADKQKLAQIDVTKNHLYSLTNTSKDQLKNLKSDVKIYAYGYSEDNDLIQFLQQYNHFNKKISYEIITESTNYELVSKYELGSSSALIVTCGDKDKVIYPDYEFSTTDSSTGDAINLAEESITNAILKVSSEDPIKVYFATGNEEYGKDELYALTTYLEDQVYEVEDLNLLTITEIPSDCDVLAILRPKSDITESQAELIKNYANNGGNLLVCALSPDEGEYSNLQSVLDLYGVKINKGLLYEGNSRNYLAYRNSQPIPYALITGYSSSNPITSEFSKNNTSQMIIMPWSQSLTINEVTEENVTVTDSEIVMTSSDCYNIPDISKGVTNSTISSLEPSTYTIGSELTRTVKNGDDSVDSKLVIYANVGFFTDVYNDANVDISTMSNPGNVNLVLNTFAELGEEEDLITVRKAANVTEFKNTESEDRVVRLIIFGLPVLVIILGIIVWNYRRKKR